jgi:hypothetical protein
MCEVKIGRISQLLWETRDGDGLRLGSKTCLWTFINRRMNESKARQANGYEKKRMEHGSVIRQR